MKKEFLLLSVLISSAIFVYLIYPISNLTQLDEQNITKLDAAKISQISGCVMAIAKGLLMNPKKKVLIPDMDAGCSLASSITSDFSSNVKAIP